MNVVGTYDCLTGISNIISILVYDGAWQRPDVRAETDDDQHAEGWSNCQPDRHTDEHQPKNCFYGMAHRLAVVPEGLDLDAQKKTTLREYKMLKCVVQQQRFLSLRTINRVWNDRIDKVVSKSTAKRRIHSGSLYSRVARRKPLIDPNNRRAGIRWCTRVTQWNTEDNWFRIVFLDESRFNIGFNDERMRVWREIGTAMEPENIGKNCQEMFCFFNRMGICFLPWSW